MGGAQDLGGSETAPYDPVAGGTGHQAFVETRSMCSTKSNPRYWPIFCHKCPQGMQGVTRQAVCAQGGARGHSLSLCTAHSVFCKPKTGPQKVR